MAGKSVIIAANYTLGLYWVHGGELLPCTGSESQLTARIATSLQLGNPQQFRCGGGVLNVAPILGLQELTDRFVCIDEHPRIRAQLQAETLTLKPSRSLKLQMTG